VYENSIGAVYSAGFKQIQGSNSVYIEVVKGTLCCQIVTRLGGGVQDEVETILREESSYSFSITDIYFVMGEMSARFFEPLAIPGCIPFGAEEIGAHIIVSTVNTETKLVEEHDGFRSD